MKHFFLLLLGISMCTTIQAQDTPTADSTVLLLVENMPEFPGGTEAMMKFISSNIRYPKAAIENSVQGRVVASFIVNTDGSLSDIKILKKLGWGCDEEIERVLLKMPLWQPGKQNGKLVRVQFNLPVAFQLQGEDSNAAKDNFIGPKFIGGETALAHYLDDHLKYPKKARKDSTEGTVIANAIIDAKGKVTKIEILKGVSKECDKEAMRLIKSLPPFEPAKRNLIQVESTYFISVKFRLPEDNKK